MLNTDWSTNLALLVAVATAIYFWLNKKSSGDNPKVETEMPSARQTFNLIKNRRTVTPKDYLSGGRITDEDLNTILEAANWAPTHNKTQPWRYVMLSGRVCLQIVRLAVNFHPEGCFLSEVFLINLK